LVKKADVGIGYLPSAVAILAQAGIVEPLSGALKQ